MSKKKIPSIDLSRCTGCDSCLEICPGVFRRNGETGLIEVVELPQYPEDEVQEAISICPADCITWEDE
jgi:ferredoxin